uniref:Uncharacterized protein n=1 Tax=Arundo donax TaxID=35708 RepID=A0A0A9G032_ARUDO
MNGFCFFSVSCFCCVLVCFLRLEINNNHNGVQLRLKSNNILSGG